ncbi:MAG: SIR2 family protein [Ancalomicrobiaceae bacterium]|nr:SIR2 family protein [Ancalomicrobiaceae bacterium]
MTVDPMTIDPVSAPTLTGAEAAKALGRIRELLAADRLVPYLGPDLLAIEGAVSVPVTPEQVAAALNKRTPAPARVRTNMWGTAQYIDSRKHRRTLTAYMAEIFAGAPQPTAFHHWLAAQKLGMIVDSWYDGTMRAALDAAGRSDVVEIQGITRAGIHFDQWYRAYDIAGSEVATAAAETARSLLYCPHGSISPANNFLVADSDYVEVLTEIDIQTPIPQTVRVRRASRGFLFLGCRFHDQMLRTYARQIIKRSEGPHFAIANAAGLTRNEAKFYAGAGITLIDAGLDAVVTALMA